MNLSLTPQLHRWITEKVATGMYSSSAEVIYEGLRLLKRQEEQRQAMAEDLRREIRVGVRQLDAGRTVSFDSSLTEEVKAEGRKRLAL